MPPSIPPDASSSSAPTRHATTPPSSHPTSCPRVRFCQLWLDSLSLAFSFTNSVTLTYVSFSHCAYRCLRPLSRCSAADILHFTPLHLLFTHSCRSFSLFFLVIHALLPFIHVFLPSICSPLPSKSLLITFLSLFLSLLITLLHRFFTILCRYFLTLDRSYHRVAPLIPLFHTLYPPT